MNVSDHTTVIHNVLYAVRFDDEPHYEYKRCFEQWQDFEYLRDFFRQHPEAIEYHQEKTGERLSVAEASAKTLAEATQLEDALLKACEYPTLKEQRKALLEIFDFLHTNEKGFDYPYIALKCKNHPPYTWLRLYAWQVYTSEDEDEWILFIADGAIKSSQAMQNHPETQRSLAKIAATKSYLCTKFSPHES